MLPATIYLGIGVFILGLMFGLIDTFLPIFTIQELGWTNTSYSEVFSVTTLVGGFFGMFAGGALVDFFGIKRMMFIYLISIILLFVGIVLIQSFWSNDNIIFSFILLYSLLYTFLTIAIFAAAMRLCWSIVAATQFTLFMALTNMGRAAGSSLLGTLKSHMTWDYVLLITALSPLFAIIFIKLINFLKHEKSIENFKIKTII